MIKQEETTQIINEITPDPFPFMTDLVLGLQQNWFIILAGILVIAVIVKKVR